MNFLISLIYAPLVFFSLKYFDIRTVSIYIAVFSLIWFTFVVRKDIKESIFPLTYLAIAVLAFFLEDFLFFKSLPLIISSFITMIILSSYITKNSIILYFVKKFTKNDISVQEERYIYKSTVFWIFISLINVSIHIIMFVSEEIEFWVYYSSFGWYIIFIIAGIIQFLHRKFFTKRVHD